MLIRSRGFIGFTGFTGSIGFKVYRAYRACRADRAHRVCSASIGREKRTQAKKNCLGQTSLRSQRHEWQKDPKP